jgi:hypothetical protein
MVSVGSTAAAAGVGTLAGATTNPAQLAAVKGVAAAQPREAAVTAIEMFAPSCSCIVVPVTVCRRQEGGRVCVYVYVDVCVCLRARVSMHVFRE